VTLDGDVVDLHRGDPGEPRPLPQEGHQRVDRFAAAFGVYRQRAILAVAHPPEHAERVRPPNRRVAKPDALHVAAPHHAHRFGCRHSATTVLLP